MMVVDRCTGCKETDVDLSLRMFNVLADEVQGRVVSDCNICPLVYAMVSVDDIVGLYLLLRDDVMRILNVLLISL